ncbi:MAG TPA: zinc dependent phospholipase C family protein [Planctomycetota bacterium]|nr:zinc dependent phospholipase C family protein [Planctomycetota bacterium]
MTLLLALALIVLVTSAGWGPGNHLEFEARVWRRRKELLPPRVAELITAERAAWQYGNIAADLINFKAFGGHYNHCHRWTIVDEMRALSSSPAEEAFALGYLAHLAADTIAHNHFVPYHLARYARGRGLGHLYWEMNADRFVGDDRWEVVTRLKDDARLTELDELVNRTVQRKALSMETNKIIFNHVLLVSERRQWREGMALIHPLPQVRLTRGFLDMFRAAAVARIVLALSPRGVTRLAHLDTSGKRAQELALLTRKRAMLLTPAQRAIRSEERAQVFLEGMQSPPPRPEDARAHWAESV